MGDILTGYQIFDSYDNPHSRIKGQAHLLYDEVDKLNREAEDKNSTMTYAIGKILNNGDVTFDY